MPQVTCPSFSVPDWYLGLPDGSIVLKHKFSTPSNFLSHVEDCHPGIPFIRVLTDMQMMWQDAELFDTAWTICHISLPPFYHVSSMPAIRPLEGSFPGN